MLEGIFNRSKVFFAAWCMLAAFGTYFCMYVYRKPFTAGTYAGLNLWGLHFKSVLIIAQVLGYMLSKFIGIKVISELQPGQRQKLIIGLILFAELSLVFLGMVPYPYNFVFLFLNGLPLGMVWGIIFSYLEGRRFTELLAMGLSISLIVSSGILKTTYFNLHDWLPAISEFWMPAFIGLCFFPLFLLFVWMLSVIPAPTETDVLLRSERLPMTRTEKRSALNEFGFGLSCLVIIYSLLVTLRDVRDNFSVEIWQETGEKWDNTVFSKTELITGIIVLVAVACLSLIRNNIKGFWATQWLIALGVLITGTSTLLFQLQVFPAYWWILLLGMGLFLAYIPIQVALFERMIAMFKMKSNAGFFIYICDAVGYLGSVALLLYKEICMPELGWTKMLMRYSYVLTVACLFFLILSAFFFNRKAGVKGPISGKLENIQST